MGFEIFKETYAGKIKEIAIGKGDKALNVGGETCYPFYLFEGNMPNSPKIAMEIWDMEPEEWPEAAIVNFKDVASDPVAWANKCVNEFGADMIVLQLKSVDPNGKDASPEAAAATVKKVAEAINVPLIVWGCANPKKDEEVLKKVCEECQGLNLTIGPVEDKNHKGVGASAMGYGHVIISSSPIDVNLAKQINILLENLGVPTDRIIIDPTTGGLGYGLEYSYSVMERLKMAALSQGDDKLQYPVINNLGNEVWKCKEAKLTAQDAPALGDPERRGVLMEAVGAVTYLLAGSDILIMRHPEAIRMVKSFIKLIMDKGVATDIAPIAKKLAEANIDYAAISPAPDTKIEEEKAKAAAPATEKPKAPEVKAAPAPEAKKPEVKAESAAPNVEAPKADDAKAKAEADAKAKAEADAKAKADAEAKAKADAAAKAKAEADAKAKAEADAKSKAEAEAKAKAAEIAKREADEAAIREQRAKEREALKGKRTSKEGEVSMTAASEQKSQLDKMVARLDRVHRRISL
ncbi:MAG: acetyl-CoA decarbonylase/synthase complex subunit delta [Desulfobacterales bacterium]|nr:acetyl-CoA decarbonylase/synthase complex subunit delta [Desulfobacterales bacterium]